MKYLRVSAVVSCMMAVGAVQASGPTKYHAEIRNMTNEDIYMTNQSWDVGQDMSAKYRVKPGEVGGFNLGVPAESGEVNFMMATDSGKRCNFVVTYGQGKRVKGPMTLIGPTHWKVAKSFGSTPAICELKVDDWVYRESFDVRYRMK